MQVDCCSSVAPHVLKIKDHLEDLERLDLKIEQELAIDIILHSLPEPYDGFVINYNMHSINKIISELHGMLKTAEKNIKTTKDILMVNKGKGMKRIEKGKGKIKASKSFQKPKPKSKPAPQAKPPKEGICYFCNEPSHWKRNCKVYLDDLKKKGSATTSSGIHIIEVNLSTSDSWMLDTSFGSHIFTNL